LRRRSTPGGNHSGGNYLLGAAAGTVMSLANDWVLSIAGLSVFALMAGFFISTATSLVLSLAAPASAHHDGTNRLVRSCWHWPDSSDDGRHFRRHRRSRLNPPALLCTTALLPLCTFCYAIIYRFLPEGIQLMVMIESMCIPDEFRSAHMNLLRGAGLE